MNRSKQPPIRIQLDANKQPQLLARIPQDERTSKAANERCKLDLGRYYKLLDLALPSVRRMLSLADAQVIVFYVVQHNAWSPESMPELLVFCVPEKHAGIIRRMDETEKTALADAVDRYIARFGIPEEPQNVTHDQLVAIGLQPAWQPPAPQEGRTDA